MELRYKLILQLFDEKLIDKAILKNPISHLANGSFIWIRDSKQWLDYLDLTIEDINDLLLYFENNNIEEFKIDIQVMKKQKKMNSLEVKQMLTTIMEIEAEYNDLWNNFQYDF